MHTTRYFQPWSGILKYKRLESPIRNKTIEPKQDSQYRIRYDWSFTNVMNNEYNAILEWYFRRCWEALNRYYFATSNVFEQFCVLINFLCIYYSIFSSITFYSQVTDVFNLPRNFLIKIQNHFELFSCYWFH